MDYGFDEDIKSESVNFVQADAALASKNGKLEDLVDKHFGSRAVGAVKKN